MSEIELSVGDHVEKVSGYSFTGTVVSVFETLAGKCRVVVDNGDGMLHIFNEGQMRPATRSQSERVSRLEEALKASLGHLMNAKINLETGAPKATAIRTIEGGIRLARSALNQSDGGN